MKKFLLLCISIIISSCGRDFPQNFTINGNADTTLVIYKAISDRVFMTIKVTENLDDDCSITLQQNNFADSMILKREFVLKKGIVSDTIGKGDLYSDSAKLIFKHNNCKTGKLNLEVYF